MEQTIKVAESLIMAFGEGTHSGDEVIEATLAGVVTFLKMGFDKAGNKQSFDSVRWTIIDRLIKDIEPKAEVSSEVKFYTMHYELYCKQMWLLWEMMLKRFTKEDFEALAETEEFVREYADLRVLEKVINNRLEKDGLGGLHVIWEKE